MLAKHLDQNFNTDKEISVPSRNGYGEGLLEAGKRNENVVALAADLTESTRTDVFAKEFPNRFIQMGITEQNMASVASGMAAMGKIPFMASYAMFSPGRNWEQIRTTIAYNESNVKIIGAHAGVSVGPDGATHQAIEDIALMRVIPNMIVIAPADVHEARKAVLASIKYDGPVYIRVGRSATPVVTTPESPFEIGKAEMLYKTEKETDKKVGIISTGTLLANSIKAAINLELEGVGVSVLHVPTIKPLDVEALINLAKTSDVLVTVEEHQKAGGLGGAVAECVSENYPVKLVRVGVDDLFGQSGEPDELISHYGMDTKAIVEAVKNGLS